MDNAAMADQIVAAAEKGYPNDRAAQIKVVSRAATQAPVAFLGVFLLALTKLTAQDLPRCC